MCNVSNVNSLFSADVQIPVVSFRAAPKLTERLEGATMLKNWPSRGMLLWVHLTALQQMLPQVVGYLQIFLKALTVTAPCISPLTVQISSVFDSAL